MSKVLDFEEGNDTGEAGEDSIAPYENGEFAVSSVLNRPPQNLRQRTEILRSEANMGRWVNDNDRAVAFSIGAGTVTWGGTVLGGGDGKLSVSSHAYVTPMYGPGVSRTKVTTGGNTLEGPGAIHPNLLAFAEIDDGNYTTHGIALVSKKYDFEGGNRITVTITDVPSSGGIVVVVNGDGTVADPAVQPGQDDIVVTYDSTAGHTIAAVVAAINADSIANQLIIAYGEGSTLTDPAYDVATTPLQDGLDGVLHSFTIGGLAGFWADPANLLREGDVLGIYYDTPRLRRRSQEATSEYVIPAASFVNMTAEPAKAPNAVIIGRVVQDAFVLANGVRLVKADANTELNAPSFTTVSSAVATADTAIREDYERGITTPPTVGTLEGSKRLGVDVTPFTFLSNVSESQQEVNEDVDTALATVDMFITDLSVTEYPTLQAFIDGVAVGRVGVVNSFDGTKIKDEQLTTGVIAVGGLTGAELAADGKFVYINFEGADDVDQYDRGGTLLPSLQNISTVSDPLGRIATDGEKLVFTKGNIIRQYDIGTWTEDWFWDTGAPVRGVFVTGTHVYFTVDAQGVYRVVRSLSGDQSGAPPVAIYNPAFTLFGRIVSNGRRIYLVTAGVGAPEDVRISCVTNTGTLDWTSATLFGASNGGLASEYVRFCYDGTFIWVGDDREAGLVARVSILEGTVTTYDLSWSTNGTFTYTKAITADHQFVWVIVESSDTTQRFIVRLDKEGNGLVKTFIPDLEHYAMLSDGDQFYLTLDAGGGDVARSKHGPNAPPKTWRRMQGNEVGRDTFYQLAHPTS